MSVEPNSWRSLDLSKRSQQQIFKDQLVQHLQKSFSPNTLAQTLSGSNQGVSGSALSQVNVSFGSGGNRTVNAANAYAVSVNMTITTSSATLTLTNLAVGTPISVHLFNNSGGSANFLMAATSPTGVVYAINAKGGSYINMVSTGTSPGAGGHQIFSGSSTLVSGSPDLELVFN